MDPAVDEPRPESDPADEVDDLEIEVDGAEIDDVEVDGIDDVEVDGVEVGDDAVEIEVDEVDASTVIEAARRKHGRGGAMLAAGMFGLDRVLTDKKKPDSVQIQEASSDPEDVDTTGIRMTIDASTSVQAPALERREPLVMKKKSKRR